MYFECPANQGNLVLVPTEFPANEGNSGSYSPIDLLPANQGNLEEADSLKALRVRFKLAKSLANGLDLTVSETKTTSPWLLMSVLNSLSCHVF
jgi:hypothetical protein